REFPVWENVVLVQGRSEEEAFRKAERKGQEAAGDDGGTFRWGGKRASWVFAGVRKLTQCEDPEDRPGDGTEVTYTEWILRSKRAVGQFAQSGRVSLALHDGWPDPQGGPAAEPLPVPPSLRFLDTKEQALDYIRHHAHEIRKAVVVPQAFL